MSDFSYKKVDDTYILRLKKGQEIVSCIKEFCESQKITAATMTGIGFAENVTVGCFDLASQKYAEKIFKKAYEITSLVGNISYIENDMYVHLHINFADSDAKIYGGHLLSATIALTGEIFIQSINTKLTRKYDEDLGIKVFDI
jgi:predicted DNA-binding protein with PD1-like motif